MGGCCLLDHWDGAGPAGVCVDNGDSNKGLCRRWDEPRPVLGPSPDQRRPPLGWALGVLGWACYRLHGILPVGNKTGMGLEQLMIGLDLPMTGFLEHFEGLGFMDGAGGLFEVDLP
ncbi:hypothetical protein CK203_104644 [Vitis vinifera]|uniref:Uncharacterized protein n=1 Tax=Vitis vinifera TaxID=29760 RepID=A0A438DMK0_VITVI|nr:hypothetical protein CK203_104644 [Vitis vinifera]